MVLFITVCLSATFDLVHLVVSITIKRKATKRVFACEKSHQCELHAGMTLWFHTTFTRRVVISLDVYYSLRCWRFCSCRAKNFGGGVAIRSGETARGHFSRGVASLCHENVSPRGDKTPATQANVFVKWHHIGRHDCDSILDWMSNITPVLHVSDSRESVFMPKRTVVASYRNENLTPV